MSFRHNDALGWIINLGPDEYVVHEESVSIINALVCRVQQNHLLTQQLEQVIQKLDLIANELALVPRLGSQFCDLQQSFEQLSATLSSKKN